MTRRRRREEPEENPTSEQQEFDSSLSSKIDRIIDEETVNVMRRVVKEEIERRLDPAPDLKGIPDGGPLDARKTFKLVSDWIVGGVAPEDVAVRALGNFLSDTRSKVWVILRSRILSTIQGLADINMFLDETRGALMQRAREGKLTQAQLLSLYKMLWNMSQSEWSRVERMVGAGIPRDREPVIPDELPQDVGGGVEASSGEVQTSLSPQLQAGLVELLGMVQSVGRFVTSDDQVAVDADIVEEEIVE